MSVQRLHEWRKQLKYLVAQLTLSRADSHMRARSTLKSARKLARWLGDAHDLALLARRLGDRSTSLDLKRVIMRKRNKLQHKALHLGKEFKRHATLTR